MVFSGELFDDIEQHLIQILLAGFAAEVPRPLGDVPGLRVCRLLASVSGIEELADEHDRPDRNDGYCHKCDEPRSLHVNANTFLAIITVANTTTGMTTTVTGSMAKLETPARRSLPNISSITTAPSRRYPRMRRR